MMISYQGLTKLKTKPIVYEDVFLASDPATLEQLKEMSSRRKAIEVTTNDNSNVTDAIAREMSGGLTSRSQQEIQKLEHYLPLLENLVRNVDVRRENHRMVSWISDLKIKWSSALTSSSSSSSSVFNRRCQRIYQVNDIYFELGMILFLYGALLRDRAWEVLSSDVKESAAIFRKAAGVYKYLAQEILGHLNQYKEKPPEATSHISSVLSLICLAEAQAVTARKAEENGNTGGLLAKLHCGITEFLAEAIEIFQGNIKEYKDISSRLLEFMSSCKKLHELKSHRYLAESLKNDNKIGAAVGVLRRVLADARKHMPKEEAWRSTIKEVINDMTELHRKYNHENEFVWHEKIPYDDQLPLPQSVKAVTPLRYQPQQWERTLVFKL